MRDPITNMRVKLLHPKLRKEVEQLIDKAEAGFPSTIAIRIVQGLRTFEEQDKLYAQGRTLRGNRVTNSRGGQSYHNYGLAIDFALLYDKDANGTWETLSWDVAKDFDKDGLADWMEVVNIFEEAGYTWGGRFSSIPDAPHFEKNFGLNWRELFKRYNAKEFISEGKYVIIDHI